SHIVAPFLGNGIPATRKQSSTNPTVSFADCPLRIILGIRLRLGTGFAQCRARQGSTSPSDQTLPRDSRPMRRKVLLVDDDPYSTTQLRKLLESESLSVDAVASGQEALATLENADYSVLITDLRMPGMGGMDLIREVAQRRVMVTTIVTTAFGSFDRVVEAM